MQNFALLRNRVAVDSLTAHDVHLLRLPTDPNVPATPPAPPNLKALQQTLNRSARGYPRRRKPPCGRRRLRKPAVVAVHARIETGSRRPSGLDPRPLPQRRARYGEPGFTLIEDRLALNAQAAIAGVNLQAAVAMTGAQALSGTIHGNCGGDGFCVKWATGSIEAVSTDITLAGTRAAPSANVILDVYGIKDGARRLDTFTGAISVKPDSGMKTLHVNGGGAAAGLKQALPEGAALLASDGIWSLAATLTDGVVGIENFTLTAGDAAAELAGTFAKHQVHRRVAAPEIVRRCGTLAGWKTPHLRRTPN